MGPIHDVEGTLIRFTPHDFRRLFLTDIVNAGFPIHLAANSPGTPAHRRDRRLHRRLQADVFAAYDKFIATRCLERPSTEYREPTPTEWEEFTEHFGHRKIALGSCHRPYGSDCSHEHACIRCNFLKVEPSQAARLDELDVNLRAQAEQADANGWLGDVDQLRVTIDHLGRKRAQLQMMTNAAPPLVVAHPPA